MTARAQRAGLGTVAAGLGAVLMVFVDACAGKATAPTAASCKVDVDCGTGAACVARVCLPSTSLPAESWDIELVPRDDSQDVVTDLAGVVLGATAAPLVLDRKTMIEGTLVAPTQGAAPGIAAAHVVVEVPSPITGVGAHRFEADSVAGSDGLRFSLTVPASALGRAASVVMLPNAPSDRDVPPLRSSVMLAAQTVVTLPSADSFVTVAARLTSALHAGASGYLARAFDGDTQVSSAPLTDSTGAVTLHLLAPLPIAVPTNDAGAPDPTVDVTLTPADPTTPLPSLDLSGVAWAANDLGEVQFPAFFTQSQVFRVPVMGPSGEPVPGATLRFSTVLAGASQGTARYVREAQTGNDGTAQVTLLTGTATQPLVYAVAVIPQPGTSFASRCVSSYTVVATTATPGTAPTGAALALFRKPVLSGVVTTAEGTPAANVTVEATPTTLAATTGACAGVGLSPPLTALTDANGAYRVPVDRGTYALSFTPALGAPLPGLFEGALAVQNDLAHDARLPAARALRGVVHDSAGTASSACQVRVRAPGQTTWQAQALTGVDGSFHVVLPSEP